MADYQVAALIIAIYGHRQTPIGQILAYGCAMLLLVVNP